MLEPLGLDDVDEIVYRSTLKHPEWSAARTATALRLDARAVTASRVRLIETGLLTPDPGSAGVTPASPDLVLDRVAANAEARAARIRSEVAAARGEIWSLLGDYLHSGSPAGDDRLERVCGADRVRLRVAELAHRVEHEMLSVHPGRGINRDLLTPILRVELRARERGVPVRSVHVHASFADPELRPHLRRLATAGAQLRTADELPVWITLLDRRLAVIGERQDDKQRGEDASSAIVVAGAGLSFALFALFDKCWTAARSMPVNGGGPEPDGEALSEQDALVLQLLNLGVKDDIIARRMNVSVRTARRQIADLIARLGATSRFQAGARAVQRGWL